MNNEYFFSFFVLKDKTNQVNQAIFDKQLISFVISKLSTCTIIE